MLLVSRTVDEGETSRSADGTVTAGMLMQTLVEVENGVTYTLSALDFGDDATDPFVVAVHIGKGDGDVNAQHCVASEPRDALTFWRGLLSLNGDSPHIGLMNDFLSEVVDITVTIMDEEVGHVTNSK